MNGTDYLYERKAVAFLDVLGFQQKLKDFEGEASDYSATDILSVETSSQQLHSISASQFITIFKTAISKLNPGKFKYYLFSDNICITSSYGYNLDSMKENFEDLLYVICDLCYEFAKNGYFLRGGIDYGLFISDDSIAVGTPLARAYELESKKAIYPRILVSEAFLKNFEVFKSNDSDEKDFDDSYLSLAIIKSCELAFINIFTRVLNFGDIEERYEFFKNYYNAISNNLKLHVMNEHIFVKYKWIANEYNSFIDRYTDSDHFFDSAIDPINEQAFLDSLKQLKISNAN